MSSSKRCTACEKVLPLSEFRKRRRSKDGHNYQCRKCADACPSRQPSQKALYWKRWYKSKLSNRHCESCGCEYLPHHAMQKRCNDCRRKECPECGCSFIPAFGQHSQVCCSRRCAALYDTERIERINRHRGTKPRTRLIRTPDRRDAVEDVEWRNAVYRRDNWTCCECGKRGGRLNAHHVEPVARFPEHRFDVDNGIALCIECHKAAHRKHGKPKSIAANRLRQEVLF